MVARPMCRLCLVVTADEELANEARHLALPNAWVAVVCAPDALAGILDSFLVRHIVLDARSAGGNDLHQIIAAKARGVAISRSRRRDGALALLANVCRDSTDAGPIGRDTADLSAAR